MRATWLRMLLLAASVLLAVAAQAGPKEIYFKAADGKWRTLPCTYDEARGVISFVLDPSQIKGGTTTVVLNVPPGIKLDDDRPPQVTALKIDGKAVADAPLLDLDWLPAHSRLIKIDVADADNPLAPDSLKAQVNGVELDSKQATLDFVDAAHKSAHLTLRVGALLRRQGSFTNTIEFRIADASPQQNTVSRTITYRCLENIKESPAILVDSFIPGYEDLKVLIDGKVMTPGETTFGVTWASQEVPGDHWVVLAWPEERQIKGVEVAWANYQGIFWASKTLLAQTWDGQKWVTQKTVTNNPPTRSTVVTFPPVKSSRLRLVQPDAQGHPSRPHIMWITDITVQ